MDLSRRPSTALSIALVALLLLGSCGTEGPSEPVSSPLEPPPQLDEVDDAARAAFALDRLLKGPLPRTLAFQIPKLHLRSLMHAQEDLLALPEETLDLLADVSLRRRLTSAPTGARNAWHGILDVIKHLDEVPPDLIVDWTRDALNATDVTLMRRAVAVLAKADSDRARDLLLAFLAKRPRNPEIAAVSGRALVLAGSPWRERALSLFYRHGAAPGWNAVANWLASAEDGQDALAAWALLAEVNAPHPFVEMRRTLNPTWYPARLLIDECVWPNTPDRVEASLAAGRLFAPAAITDGGGYLPDAVFEAELFVTPALDVEGKFHAADARCRLAREGVTGARAGVLADREGRDPDLAEIARSCRLEVNPEDRAARATDLLDQFFSALEVGYSAGAEGVIGALAVVRQVDEGRADALLLRLLEEARPRVDYTALLDAVQDMLLPRRATAVQTWVKARLEEKDDLDEVALGLRLIRRRPSLAYVPALIDAEAQSEGRVQADFRRLLFWIHATAEDVDDAARKDFMPLVESWIGPMGDRALVGLLPGLLDIGDAGAEAFARGLRGPRRGLYVEALASRSVLMPLPVAEALFAKLDHATSTLERRQALVAAYRAAPTASAPALAAAIARLDPTVRGEADDVLEAVRHRAHR